MSRFARMGPVPELFLALCMLAGGWFLTGRLPGADTVLRLVLALSLTLFTGAGLWLSGLSSRPLRLLAGALIVCLVLLRLVWFAVETSDYTDFLRPWTDWFRAHGHLAGLGGKVGNYNVPYLVFLALFSCWDVPELYLIKLTSTVFDLLLALTLCRLVLHITGSQKRGAAALVLSLALPTAFINTSVWGQCDSIYVSLALLGLYLCMADKPAAGMAALGFSFAFKLQAIFLIPVFFALLLTRKLKLRHLPVFPAAYILAVSPAIIAGKPFRDVMLFYVSSASTVGSGLNYNSPSIYSLPRFYAMADTDKAAQIGILLAAALCAVFAAVCLLRRKRIDDRSVLFAALLLTCGIPLFLPHMHDRYFYFVDVLTLAVACVVPWTAPMVLCSQFASLLGYHAYFYLRYYLPMRYGFWALTAVMVCTAGLFARELWRKDGNRLRQ